MATAARRRVPPLGADGLPIVTSERLDEAIKKLLPTHMQLIMGIGTAEELALAEVKADEAMKRTVVEGIGRRPGARRADGRGEVPLHGPRRRTRARNEKDPVVWTQRGVRPAARWCR